MLILIIDYSHFNIYWLRTLRRWFIFNIVENYFHNRYLDFLCYEHYKSY